MCYPLVFQARTGPPLISCLHIPIQKIRFFIKLRYHSSRRGARFFVRVGLYPYGGAFALPPYHIMAGSVTVKDHAVLVSEVLPRFFKASTTLRSFLRQVTPVILL